MSYVIEEILESLREARIRKGYSQRELSTRTGIPQSHISKIESGSVDVRVSSLIVIARVLDTELFLIPKKLVPALTSIVRSHSDTEYDDRQMSPAYTLDGHLDD